MTKPIETRVLTAMLSHRGNFREYTAADIAARSGLHLDAVRATLFNACRAGKVASNAIKAGNASQPAYTITAYGLSELPETPRIQPRTAPLADFTSTRGRNAQRASGARSVGVVV